MCYLLFFWLVIGCSKLVDAATLELQKPTSTSSSHPPAFIPPAADAGAKSYLLMDAQSGAILAAKNVDEHFAPASLTKIMTLYLIAEALKYQRLSLEDSVFVSERAWRAEGSRMFLPVNSKVPLREVIKGVAVASGNDATIALAEHLTGSETACVELMNQTAQNIGLTNTHFTNSSGLPNPQHYSTALDLAKLAQRWINDFPEYYNWFSKKWINFNHIKQPNRNRLLWRDESVDGMKTGHTDEAGFCLVSSAKRGIMRLIAVVLGAPSDSVRTDQSVALLEYGFRFFEGKKLYNAREIVAAPRVYYGTNRRLKIGFLTDCILAIPRGRADELTIVLAYPEEITESIKAGTVCAHLTVKLGTKIIVDLPAYALEDNLRANLLWRILDSLCRFVRNCWQKFTA